MIKNFIKYLFEKYCQDERSIFYIEEQKFTKEELLVIYTECLLILQNGTFDKVIDMVIAESEKRQLYVSKNFPVTITEAELEKERRVGIEILYNKIKEFSKKVPKKETDFNKYNIL